MGKCKHYKEYINVEVEIIGRRIESVRQELSKKLGREVTKREAQTEYMQTLLNGNAKEFRDKFCADCPDKDNCET